MDWISLRFCRTVGIANPRVLALLAPAVALLIPTAFAWSDPPPAAAHGGEEIRVARLVRELGAPEFVVRQQADEQLSRLGPESRRSLEDALDDEDLEVRLRARRLLERLKLDAMWAGAVVRYEARGEPASKVLSALAAQSGNHIHIGDPYGQFAESALDAKFATASYWEAVDDICHRTGNRIRPHYDMHTPGIVVSAGADGRYPRAYGGPVRAQITGARRVFIEELNYEDQKAELTHIFQISMQFTWEDRFRLVGYAAQPELVEAVTDNRVAVSSAQMSAGGWNATSRGLRQVTASMKLNPVPVSAKTLDVFRIRWGLIAVAEPAVLEIPQLELLRVYSQDDVAVKVESIEQQPAGTYVVSLSITRDLAMPEPPEIVFQEYEAELLDGQGRALRMQNQANALTDRGVQLKLTFGSNAPDGEPRSLKLRYPRLRARRDLELVFRNVPLPVGKPE